MLDSVCDYSLRMSFNGEEHRDGGNSEATSGKSAACEIEDRRLNVRLLSALLCPYSVMPAQSLPIHDARATACGSRRLCQL